MTETMRIMIVGAGGHARTVAGIVERLGQAEAVGVADRDAANIGEAVGHTKIVSSLADMTAWRDMGVTHVALAIGDNAERRRVADTVRAATFELATLVHPSAILESGVVVGPGTVICAGAILGAEVRIGEGVIINTGAIVDHETTVGDYCHVAPGCRLAGRVRVGDDAFIGIGSSIVEQIKIGHTVVIGAGSVVAEDIPDNATAFGAPAVIRRG